MDYFTNHCWCSESNWNNDFFDCRHLVTIAEEYDGDDYDKLVEHIKIIDSEAYKLSQESVREHLGDNTIELDPSNYYKRSKKLKTEVFDWLLANVEDNKDGKAWCVGSLEYCTNSYAKKYTIFFKRRKDAFAFVKRWSKYKKFTSQFNYFKDKGKDLDLETMKYKHWER